MIVSAEGQEIVGKPVRGASMDPSSILQGKRASFITANDETEAFSARSFTTKPLVFSSATISEDPSSMKICAASQGKLVEISLKPFCSLTTISSLDKASSTGKQKQIAV